MSVTPDFTGFGTAMARLRREFGVDARFVVPAVSVWPDDTPIDPETGTPYDPYAEPVEGGTADVTVRATLVARPLNRLLADERQETPIGRLASDSAALIMGLEEAAQVEGATHVFILGVRYKVTDQRRDVTAHAERVVAFLRKG